MISHIDGVLRKKNDEEMSVEVDVGVAVGAPVAVAVGVASVGVTVSGGVGVAVVVDVAIDQGGCFETSRPTNFAEPTYRVDDVVHYCVTNMPGAVARTSTFALNSATLPFIIELAEKGYARALGEDPHFAAGLNVCRGRITHPAVAAALERPYTPPGEALAG